MTLADLYATAPCGLLSSTADGTITEANATLEALTGLTREQLVGTRFAALLEPGSRMFYETRHLPVLRLTGEVREVAVTLRRADGSTLPVLLNSTLGDGGSDGDSDRDGASGIQTAVFDATERTDYERGLLDARRSADVSALRLGVLQRASSAFASSLTEDALCAALAASAREGFDASFTAVALVDESGVFRVVAGDHPPIGLGTVNNDVDSELPKARAIRLREPVTIASPAEAEAQFPELAAGLREARIRSVSVMPILDGDRPLGVVACSFLRERDFDHDFLELQAALARQAAEVLVRIRLQRQLEVLALYDQLTGLLNRELMREGVSSAIGAAVAATSPISLFFIDLDGFKEVNDQRGHRVGDAVLREIAERVRSSVRVDDLVGRFGGDEFVVLCAGVGHEGASAIGEALRHAVRAPLDGVPAELPITASIGVAVYEPALGRNTTTDDLLSLADDAMYASKGAGKDRVTLVVR
jgi:diguanylate cyclase (GGDEF)-like protein/PAS domain S-box-containing protein